MSQTARRLAAIAAMTGLVAMGCGDDDDDGMPVDGGSDMNVPMLDMTMADMTMEDMNVEDDMDVEDDMNVEEDMNMPDMNMPDMFTGPATSAQIQEVLDAADGAVAVTIENALVTYLKPAIEDDLDGAGFFVQAEQMGPALYINVDPATLSTPAAVGQSVDFRVTMKATDGASGIVFAEAIDMWMVNSTGNSIDFLVQDVNAVDLVTDLDDYFAELITVTGTIEDTFGFAGTGFGAAQITTAGVATATSDLRLRVPDSVRDGSDLGVGCTVDVGPTPLWKFSSTAQVSAWTNSDFTVTDCPEPAAADLVFTEIGYQFAGGDDDLEFIEIHNPSEFGFDIGGCILADDNGPGDADALTLPGSILVGPGEYVVIAGSASEITGDAVLPASLGFGGSDAVSLTCSGTEIDIVDWNGGGFPSTEDVSAQLDTGLEDTTSNDDVTLWCDTPAGNTYGTMSRLGTPGAANVPCPCPAATRVVINEIDYDDPSGDDHEFIELYNPTAAAVNITGWTLALFNGNNDREYANVVLDGTIAAGGYYVVIVDGSDVTGTGTATLPSSGIQNGAPDAVGLFDGALVTGSLVDFISYEGDFAANLLDRTGVTTLATVPAAMQMSIGTDDPSDELGSLARVSDACDRMMPARDWGRLTTATPGAAN